MDPNPVDLSISVDAVKNNSEFHFVDKKANLDITNHARDKHTNDKTLSKNQIKIIYETMFGLNNRPFPEGTWRVKG